MQEREFLVIKKQSWKKDAIWWNEIFKKRKDIFAYWYKVMVLAKIHTDTYAIW
jgi:hypothetical protein